MSNHRIQKRNDVKTRFLFDRNRLSQIQISNKEPTKSVLDNPRQIPRTH